MWIWRRCPSHRTLGSLTNGVRLIVELQQEFEMQISLGEIDLDHFRTVEQIAEFVMQHQGESAAV